MGKLLLFEVHSISFSINSFVEGRGTVLSLLFPSSHNIHNRSHPSPGPTYFSFLNIYFFFFFQSCLRHLFLCFVLESEVVVSRPFTMQGGHQRGPLVDLIHFKFCGNCHMGTPGFCKCLSVKLFRAPLKKPSLFHWWCFELWISLFHFFCQFEPSNFRMFLNI